MGNAERERDDRGALHVRPVEHLLAHLQDEGAHPGPLLHHRLARQALRGHGLVRQHRCEDVEIENPSFERTLVDGTAPGWYYGPGQPTGIGHATLAHNQRHGLTSIVLPWFDLVTIREWAQVVGEARRRGRKVLGIMDTPWGHPNAYPNFRETAIVSWKIPAKGERGWVRFDPPEEE